MLIPQSPVVMTPQPTKADAMMIPEQVPVSGPLAGSDFPHFGHGITSLGVVAEQIVEEDSQIVKLLLRAFPAMDPTLLGSPNAG